MKFWELGSGIYIQLSEEEQELVDMLHENEDMTLSERQEIVAQNLTRKDVFIREDFEDGRQKFGINYHVDVWRD